MKTSTQAKYIVDSAGRRTAVVISVREFKSLVHELEDLRDAQFVDEAEATAEGFVGLGELRRQPKAYR